MSAKGVGQMEKTDDEPAIGVAQPQDLRLVGDDQILAVGDDPEGSREAFFEDGQLIFDAVAVGHLAGTA